MKLVRYNPIQANARRVLPVSARAEVSEMLGALENPLTALACHQSRGSTAQERFHGMMRFHSDLTLGMPRQLRGPLDAAFAPVMQSARREVEASFGFGVMSHPGAREYLVAIGESLAQSELVFLQGEARRAAAVRMLSQLTQANQAGFGALGTVPYDWDAFLALEPREICEAHPPLNIQAAINGFHSRLALAHLPPVLESILRDHFGRIRDLFYREHFTRIDPRYTADLSRFVATPTVHTFKAAMDSLGFGGDMRALPSVEVANVGSALMRPEQQKDHVVRVFYTADQFDVATLTAAPRRVNVVAITGPLTFEIGYWGGQPRVGISLSSDVNRGINVYPYNMMVASRRGSFDHVVEVSGHDPLASAVLERMARVRLSCSAHDYPIGYCATEGLYGVSAAEYSLNSSAQAVTILAQLALGKDYTAPLRGRLAEQAAQLGVYTEHEARIAGVPVTLGEALRRAILAREAQAESSIWKRASIATRNHVFPEFVRATIDHVYWKDVQERGFPQGRRPSQARQQLWRGLRDHDTFLSRLYAGETISQTTLRLTTPHEYSRASRRGGLHAYSQLGYLQSPIDPQLRHALHVVRYLGVGLGISEANVDNVLHAGLEDMHAAINAVEKDLGISPSLPPRSQRTALLAQANSKSDT